MEQHIDQERLVVLAERATAPRHPNLILHCGAHASEKREVLRIPTPRATATWNPIPHAQLIELVESTILANRLGIGTVAHSLTHDGARYFGLMEITDHTEVDDYCWVLGLRNSHDKTFPAAVTAGAQVFVCDNLSFTGEVTLARKHTRFICRDLPLLVERAIGQLVSNWHDQALRFEVYKRNGLPNQIAHDLLIRSVDVGVCSNRLVPEVLRWWRKPPYEQFEPRTVWSLFNAFTEALKQGNLAELPKRTEALHGLLDSHVGLASGRK